MLGCFTVIRLLTSLLFPQPEGGTLTHMPRMVRCSTHFVHIPGGRKKERVNKDTFLLKKFLKKLDTLSFVFQEFVCQAKIGNSICTREEENGYWRQQ